MLSGINPGLMSQVRTLSAGRVVYEVLLDNHMIFISTIWVLNGEVTEQCSVHIIRSSGDQINSCCYYAIGTTEFIKELDLI